MERRDFLKIAPRALMGMALSDYNNFKPWIGTETGAEFPQAIENITRFVNERLVTVTGPSFDVAGILLGMDKTVGNFQLLTSGAEWYHYVLQGMIERLQFRNGLVEYNFNQYTSPEDVITRNVTSIPDNSSTVDLLTVKNPLRLGILRQTIGPRNLTSLNELPQSLAEVQHNSPAYVVRRNVLREGKNAAWHLYPGRINITPNNAGHHIVMHIETRPGGDTPSYQSSAPVFDQSGNFIGFESTGSRDSNTGNARLLVATSNLVNNLQEQRLRRYIGDQPIR